MLKKTLITAVIIIALILVAGLGFSCGYKFKGKEVSESQLDQLEKSKVIQSLLAMANGEITKISERTITLTTEEEDLMIPIKEDAEVNSLIAVEIPAEPKEGDTIGTETNPIRFEDLKRGDEVSVLIEITSTGELEGKSVTVFPTFAQ
jgi:preprotein translocase subunit SecF